MLPPSHESAVQQLATERQLERHWWHQDQEAVEPGAKAVHQNSMELLERPMMWADERRAQRAVDRPTRPGLPP